MSTSRILSARLAERERLNRLRELRPRRGIDLCSNDYLGFAADDSLRRRVREAMETAPLGSSGSRLLRGQLEVFDEIEAQLGRFCGKEAAVLFPSGYQANLGLISALLQPGDFVFSDESNHASLIDAIRLSRAEKRAYRHCDVQDLRMALEACRGASGLKCIVTESLFSMDGDIAPLSELAELAEEHSAALIIDEAHATGLWGDFGEGRGGGIVQSLGLTSTVFATLHTGGKALGCGGAWVACDSQLKHYLVNFSRPLIFSTAPMPAVFLALREALSHWNEVGATRAMEVRRRAELLRAFVSGMGQGGPIVPIFLGGDERALEIAGQLQEKGFDVRAIRPPTVPDGSARLRVTVHWSLDPETLAEFATELRRLI